MNVLIIGGIVISIVLLVIIFLIRRSHQYKGLTIYKCPSYNNGKLYSELYNRLNLEFVSNPKQAIFYQPCGYTNVERDLKKHSPSPGQIVFGIDGCDNIVAKNGLWKTLSKIYGRNRAAQLVPKTYIPTDTRDLKNLVKEYKPMNIYVMKKNVQRQLGIKLTRNLGEMLGCGKQQYVVIQEYLMNPLVFDGRKFDIRVYLLVIIKDGRHYFYRHSGGRCHYTSTAFDTNTLDVQKHIPSGYNEDTAFKASHPETLKDLQEYLNAISGKGDYFFYRLDQMLKDCCKAFTTVLGKNPKYKDTVRCQLFGLDILSDQNYRPVLIEINKGPEMSWSSEPERQYKKKLLEDMFELLGYPVSSSPNEYHSILEVDV